MVRTIISRLLRETADRIDAGTCELSESEVMDIFKLLGHEALSKEMACKYLNISRSAFDGLVRVGKIPAGRKRLGFKELVWFRDELSNVLKK